MMKLKLALMTAIVVGTTSMAAAQTYVREAPWYAIPTWITPTPPARLPASTETRVRMAAANARPDNL